MTKKYVTPDVRAVEIETSPLMASAKGSILDMEGADDDDDDDDDDEE